MAEMAEKSVGYPELASFMGPFRRMGLYKRFAALNAYSLLVQQAEILDLEAKLRARIEVDMEAGLPYHKNVFSLMETVQTSGSVAPQWQMLLDIRGKLKEYNAAVLQQAEMARLPRPRRYNFQLLQDWLAREEGGNNFLAGDEGRPWWDDQMDDLVTVNSSDYDSLTHWTEEKLVPWAVNHKIMKKTSMPGHEAIGLMEWQDSIFEKIARVVSVVLSTFIPSLSIIILFFIHNVLWRILTATFLTLCFSAALAMTTSARPAELFGATAALVSLS
ncbi:hypothetical protein LTR15_002426 [Elasticomyces elasticus]|nr:hypothetical protein LTR15_002426 [Elasticomyces elasticus]